MTQPKRSFQVVPDVVRQAADPSVPPEQIVTEYTKEELVQAADKVGVDVKAHDTKTDIAEKLVDAADDEPREGAPKLETPESPASPPQETPRDEEPSVETPEDPADPPEDRDETQVISVGEVTMMGASPPPKPKPRTIDTAAGAASAPTLAALVQAFGGGPGAPSPIPLTNDEAAQLSSQHNL